MIETAVGTCKYCGQTCTVEVEEGCSQEQVDDKIRGGIKADDGCEIQKRSE